MDVRLRVAVGARAGQEIRVSGPKFFIGRADDCQLRPRSDLISRHHCALLIEESSVAIRDFGSKNGSYVNGERVGVERELHDGDRLHVGPLDFEVCIGAPAPASKRPAVQSVKEAAARTAEGVASQSDDDVTQWLDDADAEAGNADTQLMQSSETEEISSGQSDTNNDTPSPAVSEKTSSPSPPKKGPPGKLPKQKPDSGDSREAASDVLRKFFHRR